MGAPSFTFDDLLTMFEATVQRHGSRSAFGTRAADGSWSWITWSDFAKKVDALRAGLAGLGVERGDRVAVISNNRLEWLIGAFATYGRAATWVPMYEAMLDKDWKHILSDSGAKVVFVASEDIDRRVAGLLPDLRRVRFGADFEALLAEGAARPVAPLRPSGDDIAYFIYTSGTTGTPKGVRLTHRGLVSNAQALALAFPVSHEDRTLAFLPWAHVGGAGTEVNTLVLSGASTGICEKPDFILESLPRVQPTILIAVPRIWNKIHAGVLKQMAERPKPVQRLFEAGLAAATKRHRGDRLGVGETLALALARRLIFSKVVAKFGGRLKYAASGAAALSPEVGRFVQALGIEVYEGYGMTEVSSLATCNPQGAARIGSVGKVLPGVRIEIDAEAAGDREQGGEIVIHGHGVMAGYQNLPDETAAVLTPDGGVRSGDLGRIDADGYVYITGRVKEIYKLETGKYVSPAPIEERLTLSPLVAQAMVHGHDRPFNVALIVPDKAVLEPWAKENGLADVDLAALCAHPKVREAFAAEIEKYAADKSYERVKDFVLVPEELTVENDMLTPSLKIKRRVVMKRHGDALEALYARA